MSGPLKQVGGSLSKLQAGLGQMGKGLGQVGAGLNRIGTIAATAAVAGLGAVVTTAASFEQAFTGVEKTVDGTDAQLAELEGTLRQMARTMPVAFEELAAIGEAGGALGVARDSLDEFIDVVARLAVSTDLDADAAATALGQLGTVLHLTGQDYEDFADSLVALGNAGASTESQIVELAARFAAAGNSAGLSKEEILALASATASMGIEVEAGGTALSQTFNGITAAIGTGSDEVKAYTKTLGISAAEFKRRWTEDALGTFTDFLTELAKLDKYKQADVLARAGITGVRQTNAVMLMTQNLGFFADQLEVATTAQGALDEESQKFFDTSAGQWKILQGNVRDAAATIGAELLPVANSLIKDFVEKLQEPGTQSMLKNLGKDIAGGVKGLISELKGTDFSGIIGGMKLAAEVAKGAFDAFRSLPEPIQQLAIAALIANKVSGGAVGMIAKGLGNLVLGSLKTITAANVTVIGGNVTGGGVPGAPGAPGTGKGVGGRLGGALIGVAGTAGIVAAVTGGFQNWQDAQDAKTPQDVIDVITSTSIGGLIAKAVSEPIEGVIDELRDGNEKEQGAVPKTWEFLRAQLAEQRRWTGLAESMRAETAEGMRLQQLAYDADALAGIERAREAHQRTIDAARMLEELRMQTVGINRVEQRIGPPSIYLSPNFNVSLTSNVAVSVSNIVRTVNSYTAAMGSGPGGAVSNPY